MTASVHLPPFAERLRLSQVKLKWCHWRTSNFFDEFGLRKIKIICTFVIMPPSSEFWIKLVDMYVRWIDRGMRIVNSCKIIIMYVNENWSSFFRSPNSSNFFEVPRRHHLNLAWLSLNLSANGCKQVFRSTYYGWLNMTGVHHWW